MSYYILPKNNNYVDIKPIVDLKKINIITSFSIYNYYKDVHNQLIKIISEELFDVSFNSMEQIYKEFNPHEYIFSKVPGSKFSVSKLKTKTNLFYEFLEISTTVDNLGYQFFSKHNGTGTLRYIDIYTGNNTNQIVLQTSGNVGVNTLNPQFKLDVNGTFNCNDLVTFANTSESLNSSTASFVISGGVSISNTTDVTSVTEGGSLTLAGGMSVGKSIIIGGVTKFLDTTPSNSYSEASVIIQGGLSIGSGQNAVNVGNGGGLSVAGGAAIGGDLYVGGSINGSGSSSSTYAYLTLTATDESINLSTGSLVTFGGITIQCERNATNVSNGGALLTLGGASIGKDLYIGGSNFIYGVTNYTVNTSNVINLYDTFNIKRFSIDKNTSSHNFSLSRYNSLGVFIEKTIDCSNSDGTITFNNTTISSSINSASLQLKGGLSIATSNSAVSLSDGGGITLAGGASIGKNMFVGGDILLSSTTHSNDVSSGSLVLHGGAGISGDINVLGNALIVGNLTVQGQTTTIDTTNTTLKDNIFVLNSGPSGSNDSGIIIQRYQQDNNIGSGDVINDNYALQLTLPDQSGLTGTQIKLSTQANAVDNYYLGWWIKITSGFSSNQVRRIISYNGTTKIVTVSSTWINQNPSAGDSVCLYNKPFVGIIYNETSNRFEFGSTVQDPGQTNVTFTDHMPIYFSSATSSSTSVSSSASSGSIVMSGGLSISNTKNASSITSGGTFTTLGGASIGKNLYIGTSLNVNNTNMTPNQEDIFSPMSFNIQNNQASFVDITGLVFSNAIWGFDCYLSARIVASNNLFVNFHIRGVNRNNSWEIIKTYVGDDTGIEFSMTNYGQIQYTTPNYIDFTLATFKWRAFVN